VTGEGPLEKGLKRNAIGFVSSCVIGVASTAPGYSLAATLGFVAVAVGVQGPAILWVAFVPMLLIATAYYFMNRADPDCGTTFTWVTRGLGPHLGWLGGWAIVVADVIVMANLAQIAGLYTFLLFGAEGAAASTFWVTFVGVIWIVVMTAIVTIGIELSARTQWVLLGAEYVILVVFAVVGLIKVYSGDIAGSIHVGWSWFSPASVDSFDALIAGVLLAVFIYLLVSTAATALAGPKALGEHSDDALSFLGDKVFGGTWDKLLLLAVLSSAAASTQTTILPTARTTLSMARHGAAPRVLGRIHPRFLTPHISSVLMGVASILWYVVLTWASQDLLYDSIAALGLMIAFYLGLTGVACVAYYRRELTKSVRNFLLIGVAPAAGAAMLGYVLVKSCIELSDPANSESGDSWFGLGPPLVIGIGAAALGIVLMLLCQWRNAGFFRRGLEVALPAPANVT
jgi:amino acid transporter